MVFSRYILDTHCLIWFQENNARIPTRVMNVLKKPKNIILFSQISLFEIGIKQKIGKLPAFSASVEDIYNQAISDGFTFVPIHNKHIYRYDQIPLLELHRDPFDRLLLAQSIEEQAVMLSADEKFLMYGSLVNVVW